MEKLKNSYCSNIQVKNFSTSTASIFIGIEECKTPHISEHCPYRCPGRSIITDAWFKRPGHASNFKDKLGSAQSCNTSAAVTINRTCVSIGSNKGLSTSNKRSSPSSKLETSFIYESKFIVSFSSFKKSAYSYSQYH